MKKVTIRLLQPYPMPEGLRRPQDGPIEVSPELAKKLIAEKTAVKVGERVDEDSDAAAKKAAEEAAAKKAAEEAAAKKAAEDAAAKKAADEAAKRAAG